MKVGTLAFGTVYTVDNNGPIEGPSYMHDEVWAGLTRPLLTMMASHLAQDTLKNISTLYNC
jgi:hypothetical protein